MNVALLPVLYFRCPACTKGEFRVQHLVDDAARSPAGHASGGPWYCDRCGIGWDVLVKHGTPATLEVVPCKGEKKRILQSVVLEIPPQTKPIRLLVESMRFEDKIDPERDRYFYEEHTCPENYFRSVEGVMLGDQNDPHGLARYVRTIDQPSDQERESEPVVDPKTLS